MAAAQGNFLIGFGHSCYELFNHNVSWTTADNNCQRRFGHLVQINDTQEEAFIQQFMMSHSPKHAVWIGLHDRYDEEVFTWTTGKYRCILNKSENALQHATSEFQTPITYIYIYIYI